MAHPDAFPSDELAKVNVSSLGIEFVLALMHPLPARRLTASLAMSHGWIKIKTEIAKTTMAFDLSQASMNGRSQIPTGESFAA